MANDWSGFGPADPSKLYHAVQRRLIEDGLLRSSVGRLRAEVADMSQERDFQYWQNETLWCDAVNRRILEAGNES